MEAIDKPRKQLNIARDKIWKAIKQINKFKDEKNNRYVYQTLVNELDDLDFRLAQIMNHYEDYI